MSIGIKSFRDSYGNRHLTIGEKEKISQPEIKPPELKAFKITAAKPSEYPKSLSAKILSFFRSIAQLISRLWKEAPPTVYQGLYEEALLSSSSKVISGGNESETFKFICDFLKKNPETPARVIQEIDQAAKWAKKLEKLQLLTIEPELYQQEFNGLVTEITQKVQSLEVGQGFVLPTGNQLTVRICKESEENYSLELFSRNKSLVDVEVVPAGGREKIRANYFTNIPLNHICNNDWIGMLLDVPLKGGTAEQAGSLFSQFKSYATKRSNTRFHYSKTRSTCVQNIWDLINDRLLPGEAQSKIRRRKMHLQLEVLFNYFHRMRDSLSADKAAFSHLKDGLERVSRSLLSNYSRGYFQDAEIEEINKELQEIKQVLEEVEQKDTKLDISGRVAQNTGNKIEVTDLRQPTYQATGQNEETEKQPVKPVTPYHEVNTQYTLNKVDKKFILSETAFETLNDGVDYCLSIPFAPQSPDDIWTKMSSEDLTKSSQILAKLSTKLSRMILESHDLKPEQYLSLIKLSVLCEYLVRLNRKETIAPYQVITNQFAILVELFKGSNTVANGNTWSKRSLLSHSAYRVRSQIEQQVFNEIRSFLDWQVSKDEDGMARGYYSEVTTSKEHSEWSRDRNINFSRSNNGKTFTREIVEVDLPALKSDAKYANPQFKDLIVTLEQLHKVYGEDQSSKEEDFSVSFAKFMNQWGQKFENPLLEALSFGFRPEEGKFDPFDTDPNTYTQEAIMDNPWYAVERAYEGWRDNLSPQHPLKNKNYDQVSATARKDLLKSFTEDDLRQLLLAMEPKLAVWSILGLIKRSPHLLKNSDFRAIVEHQMLQPGSIDYALAKDPKLPVFLGEFFQEHVKQLLKLKEIGSATFLIHLQHTLKLRINDSTVLPDFMADLQRLVNDSIRAESELADQRYELLSAYLEQLGAKSTLTHEEIKDYVTLKFIWENTPAIRPYEPLQAHHIRKQFNHWLPLIEKALNDSPDKNLLTHICDRVFSSRGIALKSEDKWEGAFPVFHNSDWEIDLSKASIISINNKPLSVQFPTDIVNHPYFKEAFPNFNPYLCDCYESHKGGVVYYRFTDTHGVENLIEKKDKEIFIYKSCTETENAWVQYVPSKESAQNKFNSTHRVYVSPTSNKAYLFTINGEPDLTVKDVSKSNPTIDIARLTNINSQKKFRKDLTATMMDEKEHKHLKPLLTMSEASDILLWSKDNRLKLIEFSSLGLVFEFKNKELVCMTKPFQGYTWNPADKPHGLPVGMLLKSSDPKVSPKWVMPQFSGKYVETRETLTFFDKLKIIFGFANPFETAEKTHTRWQFNPTEKPGFWTFNLSSPTNTIQGPSPTANFQAYFDVLKYSLHSCHQSSKSIDAAMECLRKLKEVPPEKIPEKVIQQFEKELNTIISDSKNEPATVALGLRCLFLLKEKTTARLGNQIEKTISRLIPVYFNKGKHAHANALLDEKEEMTCLSLMLTYDEKWFYQNAPLLTSKHEMITEAKTININNLIKPHIGSAKLQDLPIPDKWKWQSEGREVFNSVKAEEESPTTFKTVARSFRTYYKAAQSGDKDTFNVMLNKIKAIRNKHNSENFEQEKLRLTNGYKNEVRGAGYYSCSTGYLPTDPIETDLLFDYLEAIYDLKVADPTLVLPDLQPKYENEPDITKFFTELSTLIKENYPKLIGKGGTSLEQDLVLTELDKIKHEFLTSSELPVEAIPQISLLEKAICAATAKPAAKEVTMIKRPSDALLEPDFPFNYFEEKEVDHKFDQLNLERLKSHPEKSVVKAGEKLSSEIDHLSNQKLKRHKFKDFESISFLEKRLKIKLTGSHQSEIGQPLGTSLRAVQIKQDIEQYLKSNLTTVGQLEAIVGYTQPLSWDELLIAFLQNDTATLEKRVKNVSLDILKTKLIEYLKLEVKAKSYSFVLDQLQEIKQDPELALSLSTGEKIYELLHRPRCFDPEVNPELLVMEYFLGFMIKESQLQMVKDFIQNPHCIKQALTGEGKTSVILPLVGLLKANGHNLVTLKFLDPLFNQNFQDIQKLLGSSFNKKVMPLIYSSETPLVFEREVKGVKMTTSIFQKMYEDALKIILNKGCVITNKRSQPLLKAKMIEIYERLSDLPPGAWKQIDLDHLEYLGKLLCLFEEREETLYDEFDKFLSPREELHLRIGQEKALPAFVPQTIMEMYDILLQNPQLALVKNTQAELSEDKQAAILSDTAKAISEKWASQKGLKNKQKEILNNYFNGKLNAAQTQELHKLLANAPFNAADRDAIALQKDLLQQYLKITLFKAADQKYIVSKRDNTSVIPCDYADVPKEGSEFEDVRVKLCYLIQYYYQKGPSFAFFEQWVNSLKAQATESLIAAEVSCLAETIGERNFKDYFPEETLERITPETLKRLYEKVIKDPQLIRKFLMVLSQQQKLPGKKISLNPHNQVSIAKASAGTSATKGCIDGLHRQFKVEEDKSCSTAKMVSRMLQRMDSSQPILRFDQEKPHNIVPQLVKDDPSLKVVIDGAGALRGMPLSMPATQLAQKQGSLKAVGYFDQNGNAQVVGNQKASGVDKGQIYSHAQARGADVRMPVHHRSVLLVNGRTPLEEVNQNEGRLRKEDQKLRLAVPKGSPIHNVADLVNSSLATEAKDNSANLFLSKNQEIQDFVHAEMAHKLAVSAAKGDFEEGFNAYQRFAQHHLLVTEFTENWEAPGSYYDLHRELKGTQKPLDALKNAKNKYLNIAKDCDLSVAEKSLKEVDYSTLEDMMPVEIAGTLESDKEVEVEIQRDVDIDIETEAEIDVNIDTATQKPAVPYYLPWGWNVDWYKKQNYQHLNNAYSDRVGFSKNFTPVTRNQKAPRVHQRSYHDERQNRLHFVDFVFSGSHIWRTETLDLLDARKDVAESYDKHMVYDTKLNRFIDKENMGNPYEKENEQNEHHLYLAQMRFEDGQYSGYTKEEWEQLTKWIKGCPKPIELEEYFVKEVLKHRPQDRERYRFSRLHQLFRSCA